MTNPKPTQSALWALINTTYIREDQIRDLAGFKSTAERQAAKFIDAYRAGSDWKCRADSWALPWTFYWQALYQKVNSEESR